MFLSALRQMFGVAADVRWDDALRQLHPMSVVVTVVTLAICIRIPRWARRIPSTVLALLGGALLHHLLAMAFGSEYLGPTSGGASGLLPEFSVWQAVLGGQGAELVGWLRILVPYALAIAAFASLENLLCIAAIESHQHRRIDADRELGREGLTNFFSGLLGATPCVGNLSRVKANLGAGGSTPRSALFYAGMIALIVLLAGQWASLVPGAVTAGILMFYSMAMVDDGARRLARQVFFERASISPEQYRVLLANFLVIVLVALVAAIGDMMEALGVGVMAAMVLFVQSSMKPVIRRVYDGRFHRSLKVRTPQDAERLQSDGARIIVVEVDGPLFFGTADRAAREIEKGAEQAFWVILDLSRVADVDPTGARSLLRIGRELRGKRCELLLCGANERVAQFLLAMGLAAAVKTEDWCHDVDTALEKAEDRMLGMVERSDVGSSTGLEHTTLAQGLDEAQVRLLEGYLERRIFNASGHVFQVGDPGESLFVASEGVVDIRVPLSNGRHRRVASFAPGTIFGEMALLEAKPRSADAVVQGASTVWELSRERLAEIEAEHPELASRLLLNLGRSLAQRLRMTTAELRLAVEGG